MPDTNLRNKLTNAIKARESSVVFSNDTDIVDIRRAIIFVKEKRLNVADIILRAGKTLTYDITYKE